MKKRIAKFLYNLAFKLGYPDVEYMAEDVVNRILDRPIEWINISEMTEEVKRVWSAEAEQLLNNQVFQSLCGKKDGEKITNGMLAKNLMEDTFRFAGNYEAMRDARMIMVGGEKIREYAEDFLLSKEEPPTEDRVHDAV